MRTLAFGSTFGTEEEKKNTKEKKLRKREERRHEEDFSMKSSDGLQSRSRTSFS